MPSYTQGLDSLIQRIPFLGATIGYWSKYIYIYISNMSIEALPLRNSIVLTMSNLFQETSSLVHALAKTSPCTQGVECWGQSFHTTWFHFIGDLHHINIIMDFRRIYFKAQKSPYLQKWCRSPWSKTHGDIISSRPIIRAHGTTSHLGSHGLEG